MQRPQATSGQGKSLVSLKLWPHFFASGLSGLAGTAWLREDSLGLLLQGLPAPGPWDTCHGLCTTELVPFPFSHIPITWAASSWTRP